MDAATRISYFIHDGAGKDRNTNSLKNIAGELAQAATLYGRPTAWDSNGTAHFRFANSTVWMEYEIPTVTVMDVRNAFVRPSAPCTRCQGTGVYKWGTILNGVAQFQGTCFRCEGSGKEPVRRNLSRTPEVRTPEVVETPDPVRIPEGTYTLEFEDGTHKTYRVRVKDFKGTEKTVVEFLSGPDNSLDFVAFGFVNEAADRTTINVWKRFERGPMVNFAREIEATLTKEGLETAGIAYALMSGRCRKCGRVLTVPASIHRGMGPDCAAKVG